jgi:hypothetical protein
MLKNSKVTYNDVEHTYSYKGKKLSGITRILTKHLFVDKYDAIPDYILQNAAKIGNQVHFDLQTFDLFGQITTDKQKEYSEIIEKNNINVIENEYIVTDFEHFATAIDKVVIIDGKIYLIDVKNTAKVDFEYISWQLSICKYLFELTNPNLKVDGLKCIWTKNKVQLLDIKAIDIEEVKELLDAEINGNMYFRKDTAIIPTQKEQEALTIIKEINEIAQKIEDLKKIEADYKLNIEKMFNDLGIESWETEFFTIKKTKDYEKETFDTTAFKIENPELAKNYIKKTLVKGSIKTKLK